MNSTNLILLIFGIIIIAWIMNQRKEGFNFFDRIEQMVDGVGYDDLQDKDWDLAEEMRPVFTQKEQEIMMAQQQFKHDTRYSAEPAEMFYPMRNNRGEEEYLAVNRSQFAENVNKLDWKLEKDPREIIKELQTCGKPVNLKDVYDQSVKDYTQLNPQISNNPDIKEELDNKKALDQDGFSYLEGHQPISNTKDGITAFDPIDSSFSKF